MKHHITWMRWAELHICTYIDCRLGTHSVFVQMTMHVHSSILHNSTCIYVLHVLYVHTDCIVLCTCTHIQLYIVHTGQQYSGFYLSQIFGKLSHLHNVCTYVRTYVHTHTHAASMHVYLMILKNTHACSTYMCANIILLLCTYTYYVAIHIMYLYLYILCT